jgi:hypothetical protein
MMETTDFWDRDDWPGECSRDRSVIWRVLLEAEVRSTPVIVPAVRREDTPEMCLVEDDHVIKTLRFSNGRLHWVPAAVGCICFAFRMICPLGSRPALRGFKNERHRKNCSGIDGNSRCAFGRSYSRFVPKSADQLADAVPVSDSVN